MIMVMIVTAAGTALAVIVMTMVVMVMAFMMVVMSFMVVVMAFMVTIMAFMVMIMATSLAVFMMVGILALLHLLYQLFHHGIRLFNNL